VAATMGLRMAHSEKLADIVLSAWRTERLGRSHPRKGAYVRAGLFWLLGSLFSGVAAAQSICPSLSAGCVDVVESGNGSVSLEWQSLPDSDGDFPDYDVYACPEAAGCGLAATTTSNSITLSGLADGTGYFFYVARAADPGIDEFESGNGIIGISVESGAVDLIAVQAAAPTLFVNDQGQLQWSGGTFGTSGPALFMGPSPGTETFSSNASSPTSISLQAGTNACFQIGSGPTTPFNARSGEVCLYKWWRGKRNSYIAAMGHDCLGCDSIDHDDPTEDIPKRPDFETTCRFKYLKARAAPSEATYCCAPRCSGSGVLPCHRSRLSPRSRLSA
jgi:hypothetical protein